MDGDHNAPVGSSSDDDANKSSSAKKRQKDTHRRTRLHWDTSGIQVNSNSVWALVEEDEELAQMCEIDEKEFNTLFKAEINSAAGSGNKAGVVTGGARNVVQVIDPKRANNGGIILARLRMSYDDMAKAVERIDEGVMTANQAQGIIEYMPTLAERKSLRDYMKATTSTNGDANDSAAKFERLCECEKFMVAMMTVTQSKRKIRALLFKLQFRGCIHDLAHDVFSIEKACDELSNSVRLRKLFGIVLSIGNRLNTAGPGQKRKAGAFTIKSLLKLNQAKAFDNKTTFLHYVVLVVQRNSEALLDFKEDLPTVLKADKIFWDQCVNELEEVETQLENVRKLALHEAKSNKVVYHLPNKTKSEDHDSDDLSVESMSLEEEVALLRSTKIGMFALSAIRKVSQLRERVDTAKEKFLSLLEYLGESGDSKMQPHELFQIITTFCRTFDVARVDVDKVEKAKKRDENKKDKDENKAIRRSDASTKNEKLKAIQENQTPVKKNYQTPVKKKNHPLPRVSSMQPNMGNVLSDLTRAASAHFLPTKAASSTPPGQGNNSPPKVTPQYLDDQNTPTTSDEQYETLSQSCGATLHRKRRQPPPVPPLPQSSVSEADRAKAKAAEGAEAREQAQSEALEAASLAKDAEEKRLVEEEANASEASRMAMQEKRLAEEEAAAAEEAAMLENQRAEEAAARRTAMQEKQRAEEAAAAAEAAAEAARRTMQQQQKQHAEEAAASPSHESEVDGPTGRGSENSVTATKDITHSPTRNTSLTRREIISSRRERARNRQIRPPSSPVRTVPSTSRAATPPRPAATMGGPSMTRAATPPRIAAPRPSMTRVATPPRGEESKQEVAVHKPSPSSNASARASARDRYARHKRMLQQRNGSS